MVRKLGSNRQDHPTPQLVGRGLRVPQLCLRLVSFDRNVMAHKCSSPGCGFPLPDRYPLSKCPWHAAPGSGPVKIAAAVTIATAGLGGGIAYKKFREYLQALAAFDRVICISEQSRADLVSFWKELDVGRMPETLVESWPQEFDESERNQGAAVSIPPCGRPILLYVSTFQPRKNHLGLLDAAERLWLDGLKFELKLVGAWAGNFSVLSKLRALRANGRPLVWLKHVDDKTLHALYRECAFTVYPSLMEGFGLPITESLWHGKPCVCGGNGALGEVARGGGCLIVDQTRPEALADGIKRLLLDQQLYSRLIDEARTRKFRSWSDYIDNFIGHLGAAQK